MSNFGDGESSISENGNKETRSEANESGQESGQCSLVDSSIGKVIPSNQSQKPNFGIIELFVSYDSSYKWNI